MKKHSNVTDPSGLIIPGRINDNFGYLNSDTPELEIDTKTIDVDSANVVSNVYELNPDEAVTISTIDGGVIGQHITLINKSAYAIQVDETDNIVGIGGTVIMGGENTTCTLTKVDSTTWALISNTNNTVLENVFGLSYGNAKDGSLASDNAIFTFGLNQVMGGEYWFDNFEINTDILVNATIGWLVIRANTITVTKAGGAVINGKGKSVAVVGTAGVDPANSVWALRAGAGGNGYMCGGAGTGGGGADGGANVGTRNVATQANHGGQGGAVYYDPVWFKQADVGSATTANTNGGNGDNGVSFPASYFNVYISTGCKSFGASSGGGGASSDDGTGHRAGVAGAKGGGGIALICKNLVLEEDLEIDTSGDSGTNGTSGNFNGPGGSGGGGAANNLVAYITKTDVGTLTQIADGGTGGTGGVHSGAENDGGNGGNGGDGLTIEIDDFAKTIDINGSGMLPA